MHNSLLFYLSQYPDIAACPIKGQIYYPRCKPCDGTCQEPNPPCFAICEPGCACPFNMVVHNDRCIPEFLCPSAMLPVGECCNNRGSIYRNTFFGGEDNKGKVQMESLGPSPHQEHVIVPLFKLNRLLAGRAFSKPL